VTLSRVERPRRTGRRGLFDRHRKRRLGRRRV